MAVRLVGVGVGGQHGGYDVDGVAGPGVEPY